MKKQTKRVLLIGLPLILGGIIVYSQFRKKGSSGSKASDITPASGEWASYKVSTVSSNLNVRSQPTTLSSMIDSIPTGTTIKARPSSASGWFEYSKDGSTRSGFVSGQFLKKV